jgi:hypothetical protein
MQNNGMFTTYQLGQDLFHQEFLLGQAPSRTTRFLAEAGQSDLFLPPV